MVFRVVVFEGLEVMMCILVNMVSGFLVKDKIEVFELLGVGLLVKEILCDWDIFVVVGFWYEVFVFCCIYGFVFFEMELSEFLLEFFLEVRLFSDLLLFELNFSVVIV